MAAKTWDLTVPANSRLKSAIPGDIRDVKEHVQVSGGFYAQAQSSPNRTVMIHAGVVYFGTTKVEYPGLDIVDLGTGGAFQTTAISASYYNKVLFTINSSGTLEMAEGVAASTSGTVVPPAIPGGKFPICMITIQDNGSHGAGTIANIVQSSIQQIQGFSFIVNHASYEAAQGNPAFDGYLLSSTAAGARSWVRPASNNPIRQTVLSSVLTSGLPTFITDPNNGLRVSIDGTPTPVVISFAAGFDSAGPINYIGAINTDTEIASLANTTTNYLFAERNSGTGAITLGSVAVAPVYGWIAPSHAANQYWFSIPEMVMYLSNGSNAWTAKQVVFLGEAVTAGGEVTAVVNYALRGQYKSAEQLLTIGTGYSFSHNIGVDPTDLEIHGWIRDVDNGHILPYHVDSNFDNSSSLNNFAMTDTASKNNVFKVRAATVVLMMYLDSTGNTHDIRAANKAGLTLVIKRNW